MTIGHLAVVAAAVLAPPQGRATDSVVRALEAIATPAFATHKSGGAVLVARDNRVLFRRAYGYADVALEVPMRADHVFLVGSITKEFTGAAILRLVAEGRIALDDDVTMYVTDVNTHGQRITIEQVLTHTSGLPNFVDLASFDSLSRHKHSVSALLRLTRDVPLHFEPGTGFRYSDSGYILLGAIIERVTGRTYADYVEQVLARPLGMTRTHHVDDARVLPGMAHGYAVTDGALVNAPYIDMSVPHAAGALGSTVDDLFAWHRALRDGKMVPPALLAKAWEGRTLPGGVHSGYGFGFKTCRIGGRRSVSHGGFINGFGAQALMLRDDGVDVIVLVNNQSDVPDAGQLARRIARFLVTGAAQPPQHQLTERERVSLSGRYEIRPGDVRLIFDSAGRMFSRRNHREPVPLVALSATSLTLEASEGDYLMTFELGPHGQATHMDVKLGCEPVDAANRIR
ncbi:MAG: serine hydrolase domain-containing protein [Gemmatimonadaceae bacterium]